MSKFATKSKSHTNIRSKTINEEQHPAYQKTASEELFSILVSSFLNGDTFYEKEKDKTERIKDLVEQLNSKEQRKFMIGLTYLTRKLGNRSTFHYITALIGQKVKDESRAIKNMIKFGTERPDDLTEIAAAWASEFGKTEKHSLKTKKGKINSLAGAEYAAPSLRGIPRTLRNGIAKAIEKFDAYQLTKYKGTKKTIKLRDLVCIAHPKKCKAGSVVIKQLLDDTLPPAETWETKISSAGKDEKIKKENWEALLREKKIGYMALLRNIRNFVKSNIDENLWLPDLIDEKKILSSKQFPFRFLSAYKAVQGIDGIQNKSILKGLNKAIGIACQNIPEMNGKTAIAVDLSGSMASAPSKKSTLSMMEIGASFGAMLYERSKNVVIYGFGNKQKQIKLDPTSGILFNAEKITGTDVGWSTNAYLVIEDMIINKIDVDRIVFFTDMVLWDSNHFYGRCDTNKVKKAIANYWLWINPKTHLWMVDLVGYRTTIDPGDHRVHLIAGFNENILKMIPKGEEQTSLSQDVVNLCHSIYEKLNRNENPGKVKELFEDLQI